MVVGVASPLWPCLSIAPCCAMLSLVANDPSEDSTTIGPELVTLMCVAAQIKNSAVLFLCLSLCLSVSLSVYLCLSVTVSLSPCIRTSPSCVQHSLSCRLCRGCLSDATLRTIAGAVNPVTSKLLLDPMLAYVTKGRHTWP